MTAARVFTGIIEQGGVLRRRAPRGPGARLWISAELGPLSAGESIAVNGVCLTVDRDGPDGFEADLSAETVARTTLGSLSVGARLHLERALPLGARVGGHLVTGHVDGLATVVARTAAGDAVHLELEAPGELLPLLAPKGSVALDGVSLTVNAVGARGFEVMLIPHTLSRTALGAATRGTTLNLEVDLVARYVARYLAQTLGAPGARGTDGEAEGQDVERDRSLMARLRAGGFLD